MDFNTHGIMKRLNMMCSAAVLTGKIGAAMSVPSTILTLSHPLAAVNTIVGSSLVGAVIGYYSPRQEAPDHAASFRYMYEHPSHPESFIFGCLIPGSSGIAVNLLLRLFTSLSPVSLMTQVAVSIAGLALFSGLCGYQHFFKPKSSADTIVFSTAQPDPAMANMRR